jgi:hypothetical protein
LVSVTGDEPWTQALRSGVTADALDQILVANPRTFLAGV